VSAYKTPAMLIDGEWIAGTSSGADVINPATEEVLGRVPHATKEHLDRALGAAERGFLTWRAMSAEARCEIMLKAVRLLRERTSDIAPSITMENGKPLAESRFEVGRAASIIEWDANEGRRAYGTIVPSDAGFARFGIRQPIGPVAAFTPWNFPISSPARKIGGALGAGCSIIMKASEETPAAATALFECLHDAGVPAGVVNLVFGVPSEVSEHLIASPAIRVVTFTGSIPVGKHLAGLAAKRMLPSVMELGGHSPVIVCDDVDATLVGRLGANAKFRNAGQICTAPTRFVVQSKVHDAFVESFAKTAKAIKVGDGLADGVQMGPLANSRRLEAIQETIADALDKGASVAAGGGRIGNRGYFVEPTMLTDVPEDADMVNIEPFGPVAPVIRFDDFDEAISIANRLPYGLCSYAFTSSQKRAHELVHRVESGIMSINHFGTSQADTPFGGVKESGYGREGGYESLDGYMHTKFISQKIEV
jgi:succinate-semialdehyde dehydrogenase / glutarate-semialdehyde dehydrogenase